MRQKTKVPCATGTHTFARAVDRGLLVLLASHVRHADEVCALELLCEILNSSDV